MFMHVDTKKTAVGGILMALAVLCIVLSGILEFNTLFLQPQASDTELGAATNARSPQDYEGLLEGALTTDDVKAAE